MAREVLIDGPIDGGEKKKGLRAKVGDLLYALAYGKEEKEKEKKAENEKLLESFKESHSSYFREGKGIIYIDEDVIRRRRNREDVLVFEDAKDMKSKMMDGTLALNDELWERPHNLNKIKIEGYSYKDDLDYIIQRVLNHDLWLEFPINYFYGTPKEAIKRLKKFFSQKGGANGCYFDIGGGISQDNLKDLITWFTKKGKSGKIHDCVIKVNGKEYHSGGDYSYGFN